MISETNPNMKSQSAFLSRRNFLRQTAVSTIALGAAPLIVPGSALGLNGQRPPSSRVSLGCIGVGDRGTEVMNHFLRQADCRVRAVCDVNQERAAEAKALVDTKNQDSDCLAGGDFRRLLERDDIDAVLIASPDHWHVLHALAAVDAGKDLYVEKPLGLSLEEGRILRKQVLRRRRIFQFGTQQRSDRKFRVACELVRNGYIGELKHINIWAPASTPGGSTRQVSPPAALDYDFWLGPARNRPYTENLTARGWAKTWWFNSDFAIGFLAGWGIHPLDIALWGGGELTSGKVEVSGTGTFPTEGACDTAIAWDVDLKFSRGLTMKFVSTPNGSKDKFVQQQEWISRYGQLDTHGTAFEGTKGWVHVDRSRIQVNPPDLIDLDPKTFNEKLVYSPDHAQGFLTSVKNRQPTVSDIESAVLADAFCHISDIAIRLKRKLTYDVLAEKFSGDREGNQRLRLRPARKPWKF